MDSKEPQLAAAATSWAQKTKDKLDYLEKVVCECVIEVFRAFKVTPISSYAMDEDVLIFFTVLEDFAVSNFVPRIAELVEKTHSKIDKERIQLSTLMLLHEMLYVNFWRLWRSKLQNFTAPAVELRQYHYDRITEFCQDVAVKVCPSYKNKLLIHLRELNTQGPQNFFKASVEHVQKASGAPVRGVKDMDFGVLDIKKVVALPHSSQGRSAFLWEWAETCTLPWKKKACLPCMLWLLGTETWLGMLQLRKEQTQKQL